MKFIYLNINGKSLYIILQPLSSQSARNSEHVGTHVSRFKSSLFSLFSSCKLLNKFGI